MSLDHSFSSMSLNDVLDIKSFERSQNMEDNIPDYLHEEWTQQEKSVIEKNLLISNEILEPPVTFEDGVQSPISEKNEFELLSIEYFTYLNDYKPLITSWMSDWSRVLFCGDYDGMMGMLKNKTEEETQMMLKVREHFASFSPFS